MSAGKTLAKVLPEFGDGLENTHVVLVGSHDTASAVVGVPASVDEFAFISSGTWSLLGSEIPAPILSEASRRSNFTNELGVQNRVRYLKNLSGLWLLAECRTHRSLQTQPHICLESRDMQILMSLHLLPASGRLRARSIMAQQHALAPCTCFCAFHSAVCWSSVLCVEIFIAWVHELRCCVCGQPGPG